MDDWEHAIMSDKLEKLRQGIPCRALTKGICADPKAKSCAEFLAEIPTACQRVVFVIYAQVIVPRESSGWEINLSENAHSKMPNPRKPTQGDQLDPQTQRNGASRPSNWRPSAPRLGQATGIAPTP